MADIVKPISMEEEYLKNKDISPDDIRKLREWLTTQPHLPEKYITDLDLILIYHCCEKSAEVSKQVLDLHFTLRTLFTYFFKDRRIDKLVENSLKVLLIAPLPEPDVNGNRLMYVRFLKTDPKYFLFPEAIRTFMIVFDLWQYEEGTSPGVSLVIDMKGTTIGHLAKLEMMVLRHMLYFVQECMLVKLKEIHFINAPSFIDKLMILLKPLMGKELFQKVKIHVPDSPDLYKIIPQKVFPKECGGDYLSCTKLSENMLRRLRANEQFFINENHKRVDESRRPGGKRKTVEDIFGIHGSFKKLDLD